MAYCNNVKHYLTRLLLVTGLCITVSVKAENEPGYSAMTTNSNQFHVSYKSKVDPLPLNRIHSWILHIDRLNNEPVTKASISIHGGMPAHKHGLPTQPVVTEISNGDYLVEGLKFSMTGIWQIWFDIRDGNITDKLKFDIQL